MPAITNTGTITIDGFNLQYILEGQGTPVLVIGSARYYQRVFSPAIKQQFQWIFVDHRGFTPPPADTLPPTGYELAVLLDDIEVIRQRLNLDKFVVLGHSGHAFMALEYAKKYPEHILGVVLIGVTPDYSADTHKAAALFFDEEASPERKALFDQAMQQLPALIAADPDQRFVAYCLAAGPKSWYDYAFDATDHWQGVYTNMTMIDYVWGQVFRDIDITQNLTHFHKPVFLALGRYDFLTGPVYLWDKVIPLFNDLTVTVFNESAHCPPFEEPLLFDQQLVTWASALPVEP